MMNVPALLEEARDFHHEYKTRPGLMLALLVGFSLIGVTFCLVIIAIASSAVLLTVAGVNLSDSSPPSRSRVLSGGPVYQGRLALHHGRK